MNDELNQWYAFVILRLLALKQRPHFVGIAFSNLRNNHHFGSFSWTVWCYRYHSLAQCRLFTYVFALLCRLAEFFAVCAREHDVNFLSESLSISTSLSIIGFYKLVVFDSVSQRRCQRLFSSNRLVYTILNAPNDERVQ